MCIAAAIAGAAVVGAGAAVYSSNKAAGAQEDASKAANQTQQGMFNQIQQNESPWTSVGGQANSALAQFYGLPGMGGTSGGNPGGYAPGPGGSIRPQISGGASSAPDYNQILSNLPGYQFQLGQGQQAVERNLAAQGLLNSGAAGKALTQYGQGMAQNYASQYTAGLQNLSQMGQAGAAGVATAGMNSANQIGANQIYGGNAAASGAAGQANAVNSGLQGLVSAYGQYQGQQNPYLGQGQNGQSVNGAYVDPNYNAGQGYLNQNNGYYGGP